MKQKERQEGRKKKIDGGGLHRSNLADGRLSVGDRYMCGKLNGGRVLLLPSLGCGLDCTYHGYGCGCGCQWCVCVVVNAI